MPTKNWTLDLGQIDSRYGAAADLLDGYVHESRFKRQDHSPDHTIVWASEGFASVYGCTVEEYNRGEIWGGRYHLRDRDAALQRAAALRRGETVEAELRVAHEGGEIRWLYVKNQPIFDPLTGRVSGVLGVGQDITQRKLAEETLRTHAVILETMHEGVIMFDSAGIVRYCNGAADRLFGTSAGSLTGTLVETLGIQYRMAAAHSRDAQPKRRPGHAESECRRGDGTQFLAKLAFTEVHLRDQVMAIAVLRDATEQNKLEREMIDSASREQQRIAVDLHDGLGQELTGVALMLRSLAEQNSRSSPVLAAAVEEIIGLVNRAINDTRMLAQGLSPVELERGGLAAALDALALRTREASQTTVLFNSRMNPRAVMPAPVADHLYRIAQEAVANAIRHSGARSIRISLTHRGTALELSVADDGRGIQEDGSTGNGMGLRMMAYRAHMIGAQVTVTRRDHGGTTVLCLLPQTAA